MSLNPAADANETMAKLLALENRTGYSKYENRDMVFNFSWRDLENRCNGQVIDVNTFRYVRHDLAFKPIKSYSFYVR